MRVLTFVAVFLTAMTLIACDGSETSSESQGSSSEPPATTSTSSTEGAGSTTERTGEMTNDAIAGSDEDRQASAEAAARCYVDAVNAEDLDALVGCFAPDGIVIDVSREIVGQEAIRDWAGNEVIGGTLEVLESDPRPGGVRLLVHWAPAGSSGWRAYYTFEATPDGRVATADLQYA